MPRSRRLSLPLLRPPVLLIVQTPMPWGHGVLEDIPVIARIFRERRFRFTSERNQKRAHQESSVSVSGPTSSSDKLFCLLQIAR